MNFDTIDIALLNMIQENSNRTIKEMAKVLNLSTTPIFERLKRLEKNDVIKKYVALLDSKKIGKNLVAFAQISVKDHSMTAIDDFVKKVEQYSEVMECYHITGDSDFLLKIVVEDMERYNQFVIKKLSTVSNIGKIKSSFSLSEKKNTTAFLVS